MTIHLRGFSGINPLGVLAALGTLDVATRAWPDRRIALWWDDLIEPTAHLDGVDDLDELVAVIDADRARWTTSPLFDFTVDGKPMSDIKLDTAPDPTTGVSVLRAWMEHVHDRGDAADQALLHALVAEGATAGQSTDAKPTHLHFTAGQQKFLVMVRELRDGVTADHLREALDGPWTYASPLPMLGWDSSRGERIYALRGFDPSKEKKTGVPGAEWLGFLGLRFFPVATQVVRGRAQLVTTGCSSSWKEGTFTWPLWGPGHPDGPPGLTAAVVASLVGDDGLVRLTVTERSALGVHRMLQAPIRRSDQGGYGSFRPAEELLGPSDRIAATVL